MRNNFLISGVVIFIIGGVIIGLLLGQRNQDIADLLPGVELAQIEPGHYDLTVSVPNSLGRRYHSKSVELDKSFFISRHEITIGQWNKCFEDDGCRHFAKLRHFQTQDHPVTNVSWLDAYDFTQWVSKKTGETYRLPTEEEWSYVAFAGQNVTQKTIDDLLDKRTAELTLPYSGASQTKPIGYYGENKWNIADTKGSVWEWTMTCWFSSDEGNDKSRPISELRNPTLCPNRVVQGIERAHVPHFVSQTYSGGCGTGNPIDNLGFRLVREI